MKINKSVVMSLAWSIRKSENLSMSEALKKSWMLQKRIAAKAAAMTPVSSSIKSDFWSAWKALKNAFYADSKNRAQQVFNSVCDDIANLYDESEVRRMFGKYADFAVAKIF